MKQLMCSLALVGILLAPLAVWANVSPGEPAPAFRAADAAGHPHTLSDYIGNWIVLEWFHPDCESNNALYENGELQALQAKFREEGIQWLTLVSSPPGPDNVLSEPDALALAEEYDSQASAPFLLDETGVVALAYGVKTAPQFFLLDPQGTLVYMGALHEEDDSETNLIEAALAEAEEGSDITKPSTHPQGCEIGG